MGFEPFIAHKIANHVLPGALAHYNHNECLPQREAALKAWVHLIDEMAKPGSKVVAARFGKPA